MTQLTVSFDDLALLVNCTINSNNTVMDSATEYLKRPSVVASNPLTSTPVVCVSARKQVACCSGGSWVSTILVAYSMRTQPTLQKRRCCESYTAARQSSAKVSMVCCVFTEGEAKERRRSDMSARRPRAHI